MTRPGRACPTTSRRESTTDRLAILPWPGAPSRQRRRECRMRLDALAPSVSRGRAGKPPCPVNVKHPRARATGTIASPATGSAHHQPTRAFRTRPTSRIADRYAHRSVCRESAASAALESAVATRRFARASNGITMTDSAATAMPTGLESGCSRCQSATVASTAM